MQAIRWWETSGFKGSGIVQISLSQDSSQRGLSCFSNTSNLPCPEMLCGCCLEYSTFRPWHPLWFVPLESVQTPPFTTNLKDAPFYWVIISSPCFFLHMWLFSIVLSGYEKACLLPVCHSRSTGFMEAELVLSGLPPPLHASEGYSHVIQHTRVISTLKTTPPQC